MLNNLKSKLQAFEQNYGKFIPYVLAAIFFIVNLIVFTEKDLGHDEPWSVYLGMQSMNNLISKTFLGNPGILFEILLHFWIKIGGIELEWMRILPLIFSTVSLVFLYKIAKHFGKIQTALIAVFLYVFSTFMHYYGFELRAYSLYTMFALMSTWFLFQYLNEQNSGRKTTSHYWIWGFANLCLVYTHWFSWFFVGFQLFLTFCYFKQHRIKIIFLSGLLLIGFLPAAIKLFNWFVTLTSQGTFLTPPSKDALYGAISHFFNDTRGFAMIAFLVCVAAFGLAIKQKERKFQLLCLNFALPFVTMFLISFKYPMWVDRYFIYVCVGLFLIFSISLTKIYGVLKTRVTRLIFIILSICFLGYYAVSFSADHKKMYFFNYSDAVEYIRKHEKEPFVLANTGWDTALMYAYHHPIFIQAAYGHPFGKKYDNFYFIQLVDNSGLQAIREADCDQVIVFSDRLSDENIKILLDSLAVSYPYQTEAVFFEPYNHAQIFSKTGHESNTEK
ncbi:MAG: glycosyltransferase family 39 protein [Bacteroidales bacterium]|jgi:hypothetical protein|nr:glycosyltransferase family 39 protein [Bacteroidales bacterium]